MNREKKSWLDYASVVVLSASILILIILNVLWGQHWIDSDMAAEMIFSKLLAEEGGVIASSNWYYSTEFRVLYTQLIMAPLHRLFTDWHLIRGITNVVFYALMLFSFSFVCKTLQIRKRIVRLCALALFVPVSEVVMTHLQMGNTYMSHVILCFTTFGLFLRLCDKEQRANKGRYVTYGLLYMIICVILGISGVRYLLDLLVPLVLSAGVFVLQGEVFTDFRENAFIRCSDYHIWYCRNRRIWN